MPDQTYCYPDSNVLRNRKNIRDAKDIFSRYFFECDTNKHDRDRFVHTLVTHYADLNALHPFREGNGRSQREFARELCLQCGYVFDLSGTSHGEMLNARILSFDKGDNSSLQSIFRKAIIPFDEYHAKNVAAINILTVDDLDIEGIVNSYEYYDN